MSTQPAGSSLLSVNQNSISHVSVTLEIVESSGFFYCKDTCYLTDWNPSEEIRAGETIAEAKECQFFQRNVMDKSDLSSERDLRSVTELLFELAANGSLYFTLEGTEEISPQNFIVDNIMITRPRQELVESRTFAPAVTGYTLKETDSTITVSGRSVSSIADCEIACDQEAAMLCESFSFCKTEGTTGGKCILSPDIIAKGDVSSEKVQPSGSCNVHSRTYESMFQEVDGGISSKDSDVDVKTSSLEECARTCFMNNNFKCQSFAFCGTGTHCIMKKDHAFTTLTEGMSLSLFSPSSSYKNPDFSFRKREKRRH